jgi:glycosyltransferase involved in cell wall biosynthesis
MRAKNIPPPLSQGITILHVGRLDRVKGIEILIRAATAVIAQIPNIRFILLGGGSAGYLEKLHQLINANDIKQDQFQLLGDVSQGDLITWYQKADIAVVPTMNYESFSYTVAQAMAAGLPVVASRIGGIQETTGVENAAILVEAGDEKQLADALVALCQNPEMRQMMGKAGLSRAKSYFSDDVVAEKTLALYRTLESINP